MKRVKIGLVIILALFFSFGSFSQMRERLADDYYNSLAYAKAVELYESLAKRKKGTAHQFRRTAECYGFLDKTVLAEEWYKKLMEKGQDVTVDDYLGYAMILKRNEKYLESKGIFETVLQKDPSNKIALEHTSTSQYYTDLKEMPDRYKIDNLIEANTKASDFGTAFYNNGKSLVIASSRGTSGTTNKKTDLDNSFFLDLFEVQLKDDGFATEVNKFSKEIRSKYHEGPVAFNSDFTEMFLTRSNLLDKKAQTDGEGINNLKIYIAKKNGDEWGDLEEFKYNSDDYSVAHASLSNDNNTLYFSSDMPGSLGKTDIWKSERTSSGWSTPVNLGETINTKESEMFPFIGGNNILYFSSDGHVGLGGLDMFRTRANSSGEFTTILNMGYPLNTNFDDFSFIVDNDEVDGYVSSNRKGDAAKGSDDIYKVQILIPFERLVKGYVIDCYTSEKVPNAIVNVYNKDGEVMASAISNEEGAYEVLLETGEYDIEGSKDMYKSCSGKQNIVFDKKETLMDVEIRRIQLIGMVSEKESGSPIQGIKIAMNDAKLGADFNYSTNDSGYFFHPLTNNSLGDELDYHIVLERSGYEPCYLGKDANDFLSFKTQINKNEDIYLHELLEFCMTKIEVGGKITFNNIYFDVDDYHIRPDAGVQLDKIVKMMQDYPSLKIELSSHTDCRQSRSYNRSLSKQRARYSRKYICSKGKISRRRITEKGEGEDRLVNDCACEGSTESSCTEEQHQENRRTEVRILSFDKSDVKIDIEEGQQIDFNELNIDNK